MNITSSVFDDAKSSSDANFPAVSGSENEGAFVPSGNMVDGVSTIRESPCADLREHPG